MTNVGTIGHAAFAAWMQDDLTRTFDAVLHEPLPPVLLAILDARIEANAVSMAVQGQPGRVRF